MKKLFVKSLVLILIFASTGTLFAGNHFQYPVKIMVNANGSGRVHGSLPATRYTTNNRDMIRVDISSSGWVRCQARNNAQVSVCCWSPDPRFREAARAMTDNSWIDFSFNSAGKLTYLYIENNSRHRP